MKKKTIEKIIFIIILLIGIITRIYLWPNAIQDVNCDEIMTAINAITISQTGKDMYGTSFPVYLEAWGTMGQSSMLAYLIAICIKIFGISIFSIRLPTLIISIISIVVIYDFAKRIFNNKKIALLVMALVAISPWHILQSIWSLDCNLFPHFLLFSMYFLHRGFTNKKYYLYISMLFFGLTMYTYGIAAYFIPIFLIIMAIYAIKQKKVTIKELIFCIITYLIISLPIYLMYFINAFKIKQDINIGPITIQYFEHNRRTDGMLFFTKQNIFFQLFINITYTISLILGQYDSVIWNGTPYFGTIYHISIIFIIIAIYKLWENKKEQKNIAIKILQIWIITSIITGIFINMTNINRLNSIWYPMIILTAMGIYEVYKKIKNKKIFISTIIGIYAILFILYNVVFFADYHKKIEQSWCFSKGYIHAIEYIQEQDKKYAFYTNPTKDTNIKIYIQYKRLIKDIFMCEIKDENEVQKAINLMEENGAAIIPNSELQKYNVENKQTKQFGDYIVITK